MRDGCLITKHPSFFVTNIYHIYQRKAKKYRRKEVKTLWKDERKNITFTDATGNKIRAATLAKTFNVDFLNTKESLEAKITKLPELNKTTGIKLPSISINSMGQSVNTAGGLIIKQVKEAKEQEQHNSQHL